MDNKKRLELIKKHAAGRRELVEATKHYAAAIQKHLPSSVLKGELSAFSRAILFSTN